LEKGVNALPNRSIPTVLRRVYCPFKLSAWPNTVPDDNQTKNTKLDKQTFIVTYFSFGFNWSKLTQSDNRQMELKTRRNHHLAFDSLHIRVYGKVYHQPVSPALLSSGRKPSLRYYQEF